MENHNPFEVDYKPQSRLVELCIEENNLKNLFLYAKLLNLKNIQTKK